MQQYRRLPLVAPVLAVAAVCLLSGAAACRRGDTTPPVAAVTVTPSRTRVPMNSPLEMTFKFDVAPGATVTGDYQVFVHVLGADGQLLWNDDHAPTVPTSQWKGGQTVQYTRSRFVPAVPHPGDATIEVGLYRDNDRLPLQGPDGASRDSAGRSYRVASIQLAPESENIFLIYKSGWHPEEFSTTDPPESWKWTQKAAVVSFKNPRVDATLLLDYSARPDVFPGQPQQVTVYAADEPVASFAAESAEPTLRRISIPAAAFGGADMAEIRIEVDRTFVPANLAAGGKDVRELGLRVYHAFLEGR